MAMDDQQLQQWLEEIERQIDDVRRVDRWVNVWLGVGFGLLVGILILSAVVEFSGGW